MAEDLDQDGGRPSPDALLEAARKERRGHLKIFLGAAPGVGKTYAMLEAAHLRWREGVDVVAGVVETHGRGETGVLLQGLAAVPTRTIDYRGKAFAEMDLDALLTRRPQLALVDELAHTNIPGSRHLKRHQDVEELLEAGIDVYTTLNIQHLESLNDIIAQIARVRVRETIPDRVLKDADDIELVDLPPHELIKRLKEGKVYVPERAQRAMSHFFAPGNLTALRELALRHVAERVDDQMLSFMRAHAISGPWPTRDRIMACLNDNPLMSRVVRTAQRMAERRKAPLLGVYVETSSHDRLSDAAKHRIRAALQMAEQAGAEVLTVPGEDVAAELIRLARARNVTLLVLGRSRPRWLWPFSRGAMLDTLIHGDSALDLHIITGSAEEKALPELPKASETLRGVRSWFEGWSWLGIPASLGGAAAATAAGTLLEPVIPAASVSLLYLLVVFFCSIKFGLGAALLAAVIAIGSYNFFFLPPLYTFTIDDPQNVVSLVVFLVVAILSSHLAGRVRNQARAARTREARTAALYEFSRKIAGAVKEDDVLWAVCHHVATILRVRTVVLMPGRSQELEIQAGYPPEDRLDEKSMAAAIRSWEYNEPAGWGTGTLPSSQWLFMPLRTAHTAIGVLGIQFSQPESGLAPEQRWLLDVVAGQAALAIERTQLFQDIEDARLAAETEKLRSALLSSISHDLRTPLSSIIGAVTSLINFGLRLDEKGRRDLQHTIREEAERLNRFIGNLLDMTRIESGAMQPKHEWVDLEDLITTAVTRLTSVLARHPVEFEIAPDLPLIHVDYILIEQVLVNLLENAAKYSPDDAVITLTAKTDAAVVMVEVIDQGVGIPKDKLEQVFDMFYRVKVGDRQIAGTGLGLCICRSIVQAHGGTIVADSPVRDDQGTRITVRFPLEPQPRALPEEVE
ncbi:two-component system, OmpR family, sensor histidine kinase KdpD [uncultured Gammaproteobacteria bacterium]